MAGFSYYTAIRLCGIAGYFWREIDGSCARQGFDPLSLPINRFFNLVYSWVMDRMQGAKEEDRRSFDEYLWSPPEGRDPDKVSVDVVQEEMSLFHQAARQNS